MFPLTAPFFLQISQSTAIIWQRITYKGFFKTKIMSGYSTNRSKTFCVGMAAINHFSNSAKGHSCGNAFYNTNYSKFRL